ncbi:MAG TPA: hypothetical protein VF957_06865 [Bradyrhizobium sp.]
MEIAQPTRIETPQREVRTYDATILLAYSLLSIMLLIGIYLDSMSSGTAPGNFAAMVAFP